MAKQKVTFFWFRRDLRLEDNTGLFHALQSDFPVIPVFIFDDEILDNLPKEDARVNFIYDSLEKINQELKTIDSSLLIKKGKTFEVWNSLIGEFDIQNVFLIKITNRMPSNVIWPLANYYNKIILKPFHPKIM